MKGYFINDLHIDKWVKTQSSFANTAQYKKLLEKWCIPADCLFIAGDVACSVNSIYSTFKVLSEMYDHIFYVYGNHEMRLNDEDRQRNLDTYSKRERIETFLHTATFDERKKKDMLTILKGNEKFHEGVRVIGGMCYADASLSDDKTAAEEKWKNSGDYKDFSLGWSADLHEIAEYENDAVAKVASTIDSVVLTHFGPHQLVEIDPELKANGLDYGLSTFDGEKIINKLSSDLTIWHYGHLHDQTKKEYRVNGKTILALNNSVGSPDKPPKHKLDKSEFLLTL